MQEFQHKALDIVWSQAVWVLSILSVTQVGFCHMPCLQGTLGAQTALYECQGTVFLKYFYKRLCRHPDCVTLDSQPHSIIPGGYHFGFEKKSQKRPSKAGIGQTSHRHQGPKVGDFHGNCPAVTRLLLLLKTLRAESRNVRTTWPHLKEQKRGLRKPEPSGYSLTSCLACLLALKHL